MDVLLSGASGWIGKSLESYFVERYFSVSRIGKFHLIPRPTYNVVIHLAEASESGLSDLLRLLESFKQKGSCEKFVLVTQGSHAKTEEFSFEPCSVKAAFVAAQELLLKGYIEEHDLPGSIVRSVDVFGRGEDWISEVLGKLQAGQKIQMDCRKRQWVPFATFAEFLLSVSSTTFIPPGSVLHLIGAFPVSDQLLAGMISSLAGLPDDLIEHSEMTPKTVFLSRTKATDDFVDLSYAEGKFISDLREAVKWKIAATSAVEKLPLN
jgi:hypothetical protein